MAPPLRLDSPGCDRPAGGRRGARRAHGHHAGPGGPGLSGGKARCILALAEATGRGDLGRETWAAEPDEEVLRRNTALPRVRWPCCSASAARTSGRPTIAESGRA